MANATIEIGKDLRISVNTDALREQHEVFNHVVYIGLRNILMDSHASVTRVEGQSETEWRADKLAAAQKKLDAMMAGTLRTKEGATRVPSDPIGAEATRMARVFVFGKAKGWEKSDASALAYLAAVTKALGLDAKTNTKDILAAAIEKRAAREDVRAAAKAIVDAKAAVIIDAEDLGL